MSEQRGRRMAVDPEWIKQQRRDGWPDMHPEDFCHRCGARNPVWFTEPREVWLTGTNAWAEETGREGICCPWCFAEMYAAATGNDRIIWKFVPWTPGDGA